MDFRDPKVQKIFIGIAAFLIVAYFWYNKLYVKYDERLTNMNREYAEMITNLKNVEMKSKSLEALKLEYGELLIRYREIEQLLPEVKQIPSFLVQLHTASSLTGTKIVRIVPQEIRPENFYNVASFEIEMMGTYHDFGKFIGYVANFPFIANLSEVDVSAAEINNFKSEMEDAGFGVKIKETINAKFVLSTYFVKETERLQELEI